MQGWLILMSFNKMQRASALVKLSLQHPILQQSNICLMQQAKGKGKGKGRKRTLSEVIDIINDKSKINES